MKSTTIITTSDQIHLYWIFSVQISVKVKPECLLKSHYYCCGFCYYDHYIQYMFNTVHYSNTVHYCSMQDKIMLILCLLEIKLTWRKKGKFQKNMERR